MGLVLGQHNYALNPRDWTLCVQKSAQLTMTTLQQAGLFGQNSASRVFQNASRVPHFPQKRQNR